MAFDRDPANIARILSHSRLFYGMPPAALYDLIVNSRIEEIESGLKDPVFIRPDELRIILEGDLRVLNSGEKVLGRGNFFGESALLDLALTQQFDSVGVQSNEGCVCLVIAPAEINAWLERHASLQGGVYQHLSQELFNRCLGIENEIAERALQRMKRTA